MSDESDLNLAFARIEALAKTRGLTQVERATSYGTPALKVKDRTFVRQLDMDSIVLQCPLE